MNSGETNNALDHYTPIKMTKLPEYDYIALLKGTEKHEWP